MPKLGLAPAWLMAGLAALGACSDDTSTAGPDWETVFSELPAALISVSGTSAKDVWTVGADAGSGPLVLRYDGATWSRVKTGASGDLWWVFPFASGPVFFGGKDGLLLRYQAGAFEKLAAPRSETVYGIWGSAPDDVWAVGGNSSLAGFVWRFDGAAWSVPTGLPTDLADKTSLFKVWGRAKNDVWMVGTQGYALHYDGAKFSAEDSATTRTLFTVHASGKLAVAVGGFNDGVIVENEGAAWRDVTPPNAVQMIGVCLAGDEGYAVGLDGEVMRRRSGVWRREETGLSGRQDLHSTWIDPEGGVWAVGGEVTSFPLINGTLIHKGPKLASHTFEE